MFFVCVRFSDDGFSDIGFSDDGFSDHGEHEKGLLPFWGKQVFFIYCMASSARAFWVR